MFSFDEGPLFEDSAGITRDERTRILLIMLFIMGSLSDNNIFKEPIAKYFVGEPIVVPHLQQENPGRRGLDELLRNRQGYHAKRFIDQSRYGQG